MGRRKNWLHGWSCQGEQSSRVVRRRRLEAESLEDRTLPAVHLALALDPVLRPGPPAPVFPVAPPEPAVPAALCTQTSPGIYYDAAVETVCVVGSAGNDTVSVSRNNNSIVFRLDTGSLQFQFSAANDLVDRFNIDVKGGDDKVRVAPEVTQNAVILGGDGHDELVAGGGATRVFGEGGSDALAGGPADDVLVGGAGDDKVAGGDGNDQIFGKQGHDGLDGGAGRDAVVGGDGPFRRQRRRPPLRWRRRQSARRR